MLKGERLRGLDRELAAEGGVLDSHGYLYLSPKVCEVIYAKTLEPSCRPYYPLPL